MKSTVQSPRSTVVILAAMLGGSIFAQDLNPGHAVAIAPKIKVLSQVAGSGGTNFTVVVTPGDPNANAFNIYSTTDDVTYVAVSLNNPSGTIVLSNQVGTNYYAATESDTNTLVWDITQEQFVAAESDFTGDLLVPPAGPVTNVVTFSFSKTYTNPAGPAKFFRVQTSSDLVNWTQDTDCVMQFQLTILQ